jgi:hypothetical protein
MKAQLKLSIFILPFSDTYENFIYSSDRLFYLLATSYPFMYLQASFVSSDLGAITEATKKSGKVKIRPERL